MKTITITEDYYLDACKQAMKELTEEIRTETELDLSDVLMVTLASSVAMAKTKIIMFGGKESE